MERVNDLRIKEMPGEFYPRGAPVRIFFEGRELPAYDTEPVAVALYASGQQTLSRSLKFHRPRGAFCFSGSCGSCLMRINGVPNTPACRTMCVEGLKVVRELGFPNAELDLMQASDFLFREKFDYHTMFTKNRTVNKIFTEVIRSFSGLGELPQLSSTIKAHSIRDLAADVLVIGAGPSGMTAALEARSNGCSVLLIDERDIPGGHLIGYMEKVGDEPCGRAWGLKTQAKLKDSGIDYRPRMTAIGYFEEGYFVAKDETGLFRLKSKATVLAVGAYDQNALFEQNDLVGVVSARGVSKLIARYGIRPGNKAVIAGDGPFARSLALRLPEFGIRVAAVVTEKNSSELQGARWDDIRSAGTQVISGHKLAAGIGRFKIKGALIRSVSDDSTLKAQCDLLIVDAPPSPGYELAAQAGADVAFSKDSGGFVARHDSFGKTSLDSVYVAGEMTGRFDLTEIFRTAKIAGAAASDKIGEKQTAGGNR